MRLDVKRQLKEGMKIAPIEKQDEEYSLILSSEDNCMYGAFETKVIKLDELGEDALNNEWICTDLSSMDEEIKCVEFFTANSNDKTKIVSFEDFCIYSFSNNLSGNFESIEMKHVNMKREEYLLLKGLDYEIRLRDRIKQFYEEQGH
jgi:hypothetical protein